MLHYLFLFLLQHPSFKFKLNQGKSQLLPQLPFNISCCVVIGWLLQSTPNQFIFSEMLMNPTLSIPYACKSKTITYRIANPRYIRTQPFLFLSSVSRNQFLIKTLKHTNYKFINQFHLLAWLSPRHWWFS